MDANHARPMLAFWCLVVLAAVITALGLRESRSAVEVPGGAPTPVRTPDVPELLLGGALHARPGPAVAVGLRPVAIVYAVAAAARAPDDGSHTGSGAKKSSSSRPTHASTTTPTTTTSTTTPTTTRTTWATGRGNGHATTRAGAKATPPGHDKTYDVKSAKLATGNGR